MNIITVDTLPEHIRKNQHNSIINSLQIRLDRLEAKEYSIPKVKRILEELLIREALYRKNGNKLAASKMLQISDRALYYKIKKYRIRKDYGKAA